MIKRTIVGSLLALVLFATPLASMAQTADPLQALLAQIAALQAQLAALTGTTPPPAPGQPVICQFTRDLFLGVSGEDVRCLQRYLNSAGFALRTTAGAGAPGQETTFFGPITRAAVARWQQANGVSPAAGYFGPLSRARYAALIAVMPPPVTPPTPTPTPPPPGPVIPGAVLAVSAASNNPTGSVIAGAGQVDMLRFNLTAGTGASVTVNELRFNKLGVVSDASINNLYLADESGVVIAQFGSLSGGVAVFSGLNMPIAAGQTRTLTLRADLSTSISSGNTVGWQLSSITTTPAVTVTGLPLSGTQLFVTTVSNPSLATMSLTFNAVGSTVDAGTTNTLLATMTANVANSPVSLRSMRFTLVGSAEPADIRNLQIRVNGQTQGAGTVNIAADRTITFTFPGGIQLNTGTSIIELFGDVLGSPNRTMQFTLLRPFDVVAVDTRYNTGIAVTVNTTGATSITINQGRITVSLSSDTPTGNVARGATNVTLARFTVFAAGEPIRIKFLDVGISKTGGAAWTNLADVVNDITNVRLIDDAGGQVGNTITSITSGTGSGQCTLVSANSITCHFGAQSSELNYTIPSNTTRTVSLVVDIANTADITTLQGSLTGNTNNIEGRTSFQQSSSGVVSGSVLTIVLTPVTVNVNSAFGAQTYAAGATNVRVASFALNAASAEDARITSLTLDKDAATDNLDLQNLRIQVGGTQFGTTRNLVGDGGASMTFSSGNAIVVPRGGAITVDVYADILSTSAAGTYPSVIDLTGWTAVGASSNSSVTFPGEVPGQSITIATGSTVNVVAASNMPPAQQIVAGSTGNTLLRFQLTGNAVEDVRINTIVVTDTITNNASNTAATSFGNLTLWADGVQIAGPQSLVVASTTASTTTAVATFNLPSPLIVPRLTNKTVELRGDVTSFTSGAVSGSQHTFSIATNADITGFGMSSNATVTFSGAPITSNVQTVGRTRLTISSTPLGATSFRVRTNPDDVAQMSFTANAGGDVTVNTVTLTLSGQAVANGSPAFSVQLVDANTNTNWGSATAQTCTPGAGNTCQVTFSPSAIVTAGSTKLVKVRVNSASFNNQANTSDALSISVNAAADVVWSDGTGTFNLEQTLVPFNVATVSYE